MSTTSNLPPAYAKISVVVIGRNEGKRLERCLQSIAAVPGHLIQEVIYVDSHSTDESVALASRSGATAIALDPGPTTAARGRNAGLSVAACELILFLDGDTILDPAFPSAACAALAADESLAAVWGHRREVRPEASLYNRVLDLDWIYPPGFTAFCGGDVLMRKSALEQVGGFDATLIAGEEPELCRRLRAEGFRILHIDHPMTGHDLNMLHWRQYWIRALRAGYAYAEVSARFRGTGDPFWATEQRANLLRGSFWLISFLACLVATVRFGVVPMAIWVAMLLLMSARSAWRARWKSKQLGTLFLYGIHSHLQQVPVLFGQIQFLLTRSRKGPRKIIEYKERNAE